MSTKIPERCKNICKEGLLPISAVGEIHRCIMLLGKSGKKDITYKQCSKEYYDKSYKCMVCIINKKDKKDIKK